MRDRVMKVVRRVVGVFASFTPGQKAVTVLVVLVLGIGGYFFASWASQPTYSPLFSNLSSTDASAIVDKLQSAGTPYKLADGGNTILVPQTQVYDLRLKMAGQGLPTQSTSGYDLLDKQGITTSDFMQNVDYQRALEGELAKTIQAINGVQNATVHLAIPQQDVFSDNQQKPTASVLVATGIGKSLSTDQVQAIVHLVASSVVGLDPTQVTVADAAGNVLSTGDGQSVASASGVRDQETTAFEDRMNTALQQMLDSVVGPGHAVVKTTADLDYDQTQTKTQTYVAPSPSAPPLSQSSNVETYSGTGGAGGVLGPDNIQVPGGAGSGTYSHSENTQDNAVGMVTETRNSAPGNVRRLSVAVLLDATTAKSVNLANVQTLVSSAAGLDPTRGDAIAVSSMPFDTSASKQAAAAAAAANKASQQAQLISMAKTGGLVLLVLFMLFLAWRAARKQRRVKLNKEEMAQLERIQATLEQQQAKKALADAEAELAALEPAPNPLLDETEAHQRELAILVESQPDEVAQILRTWLADRR